MGFDPFNLLCPYQVNWLRDTMPLAVCEKSRRIGWTWAQALGAVLDRIEGKSNYYHTSADMTASIEFIEDCENWSQMCNAVGKITEGKEVIDEDEINTLTMTFANGRKIVAGSSNPKFFRSKGGAVGFDEFDFHRAQRELFKAGHATAMFWGFPMRIWSSVNGQGTFMAQIVKMIEAGKMKGSIHRVTIEDAVAQGIVERIEMRKKKLKDVPAPDAMRRKEWLAELRSTCPDQDTWDQEYLCKRTGDANSLLSYELIHAAVEENLKLFETITDLPRDTGIYFAGYDVGRKHDYSVLWVAELVGDVLWTRILKVFDRTSFPAQEAAISALMANHRVRRICIDESGIGAQLAESAIRRFGPGRAEGVSLSGPVKATIGTVFRDRFADRQMRLPTYVEWEEFDETDAVNRVINRRNMRKVRHADDWLIEDLHKTKKTTTDAGNVRLAASSDDAGHADSFWAGALMVEAASESKATPVSAPQAFKPAGW